MANFGVRIDKDLGFIVIALWRDEDGILRWHPLRAFGMHQGMARAFIECDCPDYSLSDLKRINKSYDDNRSYVRIAPHRFRPDK